MLGQLFALVSNLPPLAYVAITLVTIWYFKTKSSHPGNIPPFPVRPYPLVGHLFMLRSGPVQKFHEWRLSTGDIFSIYQGQKLVVVMNSLKVLKEALVKNADVFSDRPETFLRYHGGVTSGIIGNSGPGWKEQRTVSMAILRNFGMGKNFLAEKVSEEVELYLQSLCKLNGEPTDVQMLTNASVSNVICAILLGNRFQVDDPYFIKMLHLLHGMIGLLGNVSVLNAFPWLSWFPGDFFKAKEVLLQEHTITDHFSKKFVKDNIDEENEGKQNNFIHAYHIEMKKRKESGVSTTLDERNLCRVVTNLFKAGTETTSTTLLWTMIFAIHNPDIQEKVYKEIIDVAGTDRLPSIQDRLKLNYTNAFIMETQRLGSITPFSLPHLCISTTEIAGYTIPAGTYIIPNIEEILKDANTWGDPLVFRPERFLDKDKNLIVPDEFIPFSIGRRQCMAEALAKMELFLFVLAIFQRFHIEAEDPQNLPPAEPVFGLTCSPKSFKVRMIKRIHDD